MDVRRVRYKMGQSLDELLAAHELLAVVKEPVLPLPESDRTEWLLWCTNKYDCTMEEANNRYWNNHTQMQLMAMNFRKRQKENRERNPR